MSFTSPVFLAFFALTALVYFLLPKRGQWVTLLIASYVFYLWQAPVFGLLLAGTTVLTYALARLMSRGKKRLWLMIGCVFQFGTLIFYKYLEFFIGLVMELLHLGTPPSLGLVLPIGISFFTFAVTGYLFDVCRGKLEAETNFLRYAVFVSFFPSLMAGPIGRAREFLPQLSQKHRFSLPGFKFGILRFLFGMLEKMVIADTIAIAVNAAYGGADASALTWLVIIALYSLQIYFDFAGYSHMALGIASALGFRLPENFAAPYFSASVRSFWKKWHMSLTAWLREYLYFPLGGSKKGKVRTYCNTLIVFAVSGLWHGAGLTYLFWGILNGLYQIIERLFDPVSARLDHHACGAAVYLRYAVRGLLSFLAITCAWVLFRSSSLSQAGDVFLNILHGFTNSFGTLDLAALGLRGIHLLVLGISMLFCFTVDFLQVRGKNLRAIGSKIVPYYILLYVLIMAVLLFGVYGEGFNPQDFLYFQY